MWKMFSWTSKRPRGSVQGRSKAVSSVLVAHHGRIRTWEESWGETEEWLTQAWGGKQFSGANFGPNTMGLVPLTDLIFFLPVLLQLLCIQCKQFTWLLWDWENWSHRNMLPGRMKPTLTGGFCKRPYMLQPGLCLILIMDVWASWPYTLSQHALNLIHYLPPNLISFCDAGLRQWPHHIPSYSG